MLLGMVVLFLKGLAGKCSMRGVVGKWKWDSALLPQTAAL